MNGSELIGERIRVFASATDDSDWADVVCRAGLDEPREHSTDRSRAGRLPRRRWLVLGLAVLVLVTAGATFAAVHGLPWWESGAPPIDPQAVVAVARDNMPANVDTTRARTVADTGGAALVAVPLDRPATASFRFSIGARTSARNANTRSRTLPGRRRSPSRLRTA